MRDSLKQERVTIQNELYNHVTSVMMFSLQYMEYAIFGSLLNQVHLYCCERTDFSQPGTGHYI